MMKFQKTKIYLKPQAKQKIKKLALKYYNNANVEDHINHYALDIRILKLIMLVINHFNLIKKK